MTGQTDSSASSTSSHGTDGARRAVRGGFRLALGLAIVTLSGAALAFQPGFSQPTFKQAKLEQAPIKRNKPEMAALRSVDPIRMWPWTGVDRKKRELFEKPTPASPSDEVNCLALNIYHEARGETPEGQRAVGHVVMNRVASERFPATVCGVIRQGGEIGTRACQFSWWCDGRSDKPENKRLWQRANELALEIYWGRSKDPTRGALWYHADYVKPAWRKDFVLDRTIGRHIFYLAPKAPRPSLTQLASRLWKD